MKKFFIFTFFTLVPFSTIANTYKIYIPPYEIEQNRIKIHGFGGIIEPGMPQLPCKVVLLAIPPGNEITGCKILREGLNNIKAGEISPAGIPIREDIFPLKEHLDLYEKRLDSIYNLDLPIPKKAGSYLGTINFRGYKIAKVLIYPFSYIPKSKELLNYNSITINLDYKHIFQDSSTIDTTLDDFLKVNIFNFNESKNWYKNRIGAYYDYVIIAPPNLFSTIKVFAEWKKSIGYNVKIISTGEKLAYYPKYLLTIGKGIKEIPGVIIGNIPYTDSATVNSILDRSIEFEVRKEQIEVLFVEGASNYAKQGWFSIPYLAKKNLLSQLKNLVTPYWKYTEYTSEDITNGYSIINLLSIGKQWVQDDGDGIPESNEIRLNNFKILSNTPMFVFAPFEATKLLKQGVVCLICPDSSSEYIYPWQDSLSGGSQSLNYMFIKQLTEKGIVGDAFLQTKLWYETNFPRDTLTVKGFKIFGDPALSIKKIPGVDIGISKILTRSLPLDTFFSPACSVKNFGLKPVLNCEVYCQIDSDGIAIYNKNILLDSIGPLETKIINFPFWKTKNIGIEYRFKFQVFLVYDENTTNDTLSVINYVRAGDFLVYCDTTLRNVLQKMGYKGAETYEIKSLIPWLDNFNSIFLCNTPDLDSIEYLLQPGYNIYIEGNNTWLSKLLKGTIIRDSTLPQLQGNGLSFYPSTTSLTEEWFIPNEYKPIFIDSIGNVAGFYYEDGYKIWCNRFKLSDIDSVTEATILDSIMKKWGIQQDSQTIEISDILNITDFKSQPNPFYKKTYIKFTIKEASTRINLAVYDLSGKLIKTITNENFVPGQYELFWEGLNENGYSVSNGVYFLKLVSEEQSLLLKLIVLKH